MSIKHIITFSGGHSSALVAIEVSRKFPNDEIILLNHNISDRVENLDIKRFKNEVSEFLGIPITYANMKGWNTKTQFDVCIEAKAFKTNHTPAICTSRLKTQPFIQWLDKNIVDKTEAIIYYGFDASEEVRMSRRTKIMSEYGYKTQYPLANWDCSIMNTEDINIKPPLVYSKYKHANCTGCIKAGKQHWYVVYCNSYEIFQEAKIAENKIGFSILKDRTGKPIFLRDLEKTFEQMHKLGVEDNEHIPYQKFWAEVRKVMNSSLLNDEEETIPCQCL